MRVTVPASAAVLSALLTLPVAAQRPGTIELGGLGQFTRYDPSLLLGDAIGGGGSLALWVARGFAVEGSAAYSSPSASPAGNVKEIPLRFRLIYGVPAAPTATVLFGVGYVHNAVRDGTSATISTACAWWPIMPCMNLMSAPVYSTCDRSLAFSAEITRLGWPGAPGWMIGGGPAGEAGAASGRSDATPAVRHDAASPAIRRSATTRFAGVRTTCKEYTITACSSCLETG